MSALKYMLAGILFASALASPASAEPLTQADIDFVFDPAAGYTVDQLVQLAPEEMDKIEGQYWWLFWRRTARAIHGFYVGIQRGMEFSLGAFRYKIKFHEDGHPFPKYWGPLAGNRPHWQVNRWVPGVDGSGRSFRFPWGKTKPVGSMPKGSRGGRKKGEPRAPHTLDATADETPRPSPELIALLLKEMPGASDEPADSAEPTTLDESEPAYTGPMPSQTLRGYIFQHVEPTKEEACTWVGGINC